MPDLVNDPQYEGIDLDRGDPSDPDYWSPERVQKRNLWRDWAAKQRDAAGKLTEQAAQQGIDANTALSQAGFADQKEHGKYIWSLFGNEGLFATQGNVDPNLEYDWGSGKKTWKPGTDNAGQSIPITREEYDSRAQAQNYQRQGLQGYGAHANAEAFKKAAGYGHFTRDAKTGNFYNIGQGDPNNPQTWQWADQYGRSINGMRSGGPGTGPGNIKYGASTGGRTGTGGGPPAPGGQSSSGGGWLPDQGSGYAQFTPQGSGMAQYGGGGGFGMQGGGGMNPTMGGYTGGMPNMYAGTMAATGFNNGGQGGGSPQQQVQGYRQQSQQAEDSDSKSPYKQLLPPGQKQPTSGALGGF